MKIAKSHLPIYVFHTNSITNDIYTSFNRTNNIFKSDFFHHINFNACTIDSMLIGPIISYS